MGADDVTRITANLRAVEKRLAEAAGRAGRTADEITLVAVTKTFSAEAVRVAVDAGVKVLGESRIQEGVEKIERLGRIASWHLIGHLQTNKAARAVEYFDMIQALDSIDLAQKVSQSAQRQNRIIDCLVEVNSSGEGSKFGFPTVELLPAAERIAGLPGIKLKGLMTIGPWTTNAGCLRKSFDMTRDLFERMRASIGSSIGILSMGMSSDFELAIECGSNMVRIGSAIFGQRSA